MNDDYHPHYPSIDDDYFQRIADNAERMSNPYRLACCLYSPEQERFLSAYCAARRRGDSHQAAVSAAGEVKG